MLRRFDLRLISSTLALLLRWQGQRGAGAGGRVQEGAGLRSRREGHGVGEVQHPDAVRAGSLVLST